VFTNDGVFECAHEKPGWAADNPPTPGMQTVKACVSFTKLGIRPGPGTRLGIAFDLTNAIGDAKQRWYFWPARAKLDSPRTWAEAILE
jgi:hypothetical protein